MAVIPSSQLVLSRARRDLNEALKQQNWKAMSSLDKHLGQALASAADDPGRDTATLLLELGQILKLYRELVTDCQDQVAHLASN